MKDTIIVDLDGTLANVEHRRHLVQGKKRNYELFHALLLNDPVNEWCQRVIQSFDKSGYRIELVSARPQQHRDNTIIWLRKHDIPYDGLTLVRPEGDTSPDVDLKRAWLHKYGKDSILFAIDDRQRIVDMWREEGITCLQCDAWEVKK